MRKKFPNLVYYRKKYAITQGEMAKVIKKSRSGYIRKENGESDFYRNEMVGICDYINAKARVDGDKLVTLEQLFSAQTVENPQPEKEEKCE